MPPKDGIDSDAEALLVDPLRLLDPCDFVSGATDGVGVLLTAAASVPRPDALIDS